MMLVSMAGYKLFMFTIISFQHSKKLPPPPLYIIKPYLWRWGWGRGCLAVCLCVGACGCVLSSPPNIPAESCLWGEVNVGVTTVL